MTEKDPRARVLLQMEINALTAEWLGLETIRDTLEEQMESGALHISQAMSTLEWSGNRIKEIRQLLKGKMSAMHE